MKSTIYIIVAALLAGCATRIVRCECAAAACPAPAAAYIAPWSPEGIAPHGFSLQVSTGCVIQSEPLDYMLPYQSKPIDPNDCTIPENWGRNGCLRPL